MNMEAAIITQECWGCGHRFDIMYLQDGSYLYLDDDDCDCEYTSFSPIDGQPSISQWLEQFSADDIEYAKSLSTGKACRFCGKPLYKSEIEDYVYQCFVCDEDFYAFEQE